MNTETNIPAAKGKDVPERITRAILAAKSQWDIDHPNQPHGFTLKYAIEAARAQWRLEPCARARVNGRDVLFDAIKDACGIVELNRPNSTSIAQAKKDIVEATPNVTPDEIVRRSARYRAKYKDAACTPRALAAHWGEFPLPTAAKKPDLYHEPVGWHVALQAMAARNHWEGSTVQAMLTAGWLELSINVRSDIIRELGLS